MRDIQHISAGVRPKAARPTLRALPLLLAMLLARPSEGWARDRILVVGSNTVYPFSVLVAEHLAKSGDFQLPSVRGTSTAEGFRLFCAGTGGEAPDVSSASRPITAAERRACAEHGVTKIAEIRIGYDSLVLANALAAASLHVTLGQLWLAAAQRVPVDGRIVPNPYRNWHDIDHALPERPIRLFGPAAGHGTRDAFVELVLEPSCAKALGGLKVSPDERVAACDRVRNDEHWTDVDNLELVLGKLAADHDAMGILTYSYLEQFPNRIHAGAVDGIAPSRATIPSGEYPMSRPLLIYVKEANLKSTTGLADFASEFLSFCAAGAHGYLVEEGLVPLPVAELMGQRAAVARLQR